MKKYLVLLAVTALLFVSIAVPRATLADVQTFNGLLFAPDVGRNKYMMLHSVDTLQKYQFQFGEYFSYGYRPLELRQNNQRITSVINTSMVSDFTAAFGITDYLQLGFDVPLILLNRFQDPNVVPAPGFSNEMFKMGDIRVEGKARILDPCRYPASVAFVPFMTIPTGKDSLFLGDSGLTGGLVVAAEGRVMPQLGITGNVGLKAGKKVNYRNIEWQYKLMLGLGTYYTWFSKGLTLFGEVNSEASLNSFFNNRDLNTAEGMVGVKWDIKKNNKDLGLQVSGAAGSCFVCGVKGALIRGVLGVTYRWMNEKYRDGDNAHERMCEAAFTDMTAQRYYDLRLICPPDPADFKPGVDDEACPKYYELRDVADLLWKCPPEDKFVAGRDDDACPKLYTLMDKFSQDEIWTAYTLAAAEMALRCPADAANFDPAIHDEACPKFFDLMAFADLMQVCPENPADYDPARDDAACPKYFDLMQKYPEAQWAVIDLLMKRDTDKDGINDFLDVCPERKEDYNGFADTDGCPDGGVVAVVGGEIITYRPVYFAFNRYDIKRDEQQIIDLVVRKINETPWIKRVRIAGNADARGTEWANQQISERRANAVIDYMRSHGVRSNVRLTPVGYGARRPVAPNLTEEQRQRNRRVTFGVEPGRYRPYQPRVSPLPGATSSTRAATPPGPPPPTPSPQPVPPPQPLPTPVEDAAEPPTLPEESSSPGPPARWDET